VKAPRDLGADNVLADYHFFRALETLRHGAKNAALKHFAEAAKCGSGIREVYNNIGSAMAENGLQDEAMPYYEEATKIDPAYKAAWWNLARVAKATDRWDLAEQAFRKLTEIDQEDCRPWGELGFITKLHRGNLTEAIAFWEKSVRLNPRQPQLLAELAAYYANGAAQTAAKDAERGADALADRARRSREEGHGPPGSAPAASEEQEASMR
jgi:tetratricopeptide (TPR) repeat protein